MNEEATQDTMDTEFIQAMDELFSNRVWNEIVVSGITNKIDALTRKLINDGQSEWHLGYAQGSIQALEGILRIKEDLQDHIDLQDEDDPTMEPGEDDLD